MNKFILGLTMVLLTACNEDTNTKHLQQHVDVLREANDKLESKLNTCESKLLDSHSTMNTGFNESESTPEPEAREKTCEKIAYNVLYVDGKKLDTCLDQDVSRAECGIQAINCDSGMAYACLKNVSYKVIEREVCQ